RSRTGASMTISESAWRARRFRSSAPQGTHRGRTACTCLRPVCCSPATPCSAVGLVPPDGHSPTFRRSWTPSATGCSHCPRTPGCTLGTATAPPSGPRRPISPNGLPEGTEAVTHADERGGDETDVVVTHEKSYAAGIPAVAVSLRRGLEQMGALRTARTLLKLNQRNGFDCPGCAWPETPGHRKHADFCENGAKAVAEEATTRVVTPSFFAAHPVSELLQKTDYWLGQQGPLTHPMVLLPAATHYAPIGWEAAFGLIADELRAL